MSRTRIVKGKYDKLTGKDYNLFSEGNTSFNASKKNYFKADNNTVYGDEVKKAPPYQPENSVNLYIGMFFDGTGNNRFNSDKVYYNKINSSEVFFKSDAIPQEYTETIKKNGEEIKIKISDRDSYWNPYSNVAKLFDLYKKKESVGKYVEYPEFGEHGIFKQYIEGIGTKQDKKDDILGSSAGRAEWGIIGRVNEGIKNLVADQLQKNVSTSKKIYKIIFDVFGFSRGAAAARHFCNEVKKAADYTTVMRDEMDIKMGKPRKQYVSTHAGGRLGKALSKAGYQPAGDTFMIEIRFLGIFDTVVSDIIVEKNAGYKLAPLFGLSSIFGQKLLEDINTNVSGLGIKKIFHITAQSEWRKNFALTPVEAGYTFGMLGAHSDIGGGYAHMDNYTLVLDFFDVEKGDDQIMLEKEKIKQFYIRNYFCDEAENEISFRNTHDHITETTINTRSQHTGYYSVNKTASADFPDEGRSIYNNGGTSIYQSKKSDHYILEDRRYISNKYSLVPMFVMQKKAIDYGVPFYDNPSDSPDVKKKFEYEIPSTEKYEILNEYLALMLKESKEEGTEVYKMSYEMYKHICNKYVHLSAHFGGLPAIGLKTGDHHFTGKIGFINQPGELATNEKGEVFYKRQVM